MALVQVTLTIKTTAGANLSGARVTIKDISGAVVYADMTSGVDGICPVVALEELTTYLVLLSHPFTTFTVPEDLIVGDEPAQAFLYTGIYHDPAVPVPPLCRVYGYLKNIDGDPLVGAVVLFDNLWGVSVIDGAAILGKRAESITDEDGKFEVDIVRGATVRIAVENTGFVFRVVIPNLVTVNLSALISTAESEIAEVVRG